MEYFFFEFLKIIGIGGGGGGRGLVVLLVFVVVGGHEVGEDIIYFT